MSDKFTKVGLTARGWIPANNVCPFIDCGCKNERCPSEDNIYDQDFSCAFSRGWAICYKDVFSDDKDIEGLVNDNT